MSEGVRRLTDRVLTAVVLEHEEGRKELEEAFVEMTVAGMFAKEVVGPMLAHGFSDAEARVKLLPLVRRAHALAEEILREQKVASLRLAEGLERGSG